MVKKGIPERWKPVRAIGKVIEGTKFMPFKVPLNDTLCKRLHLNARFSPAMLMEKEPKIQLIIDLTNTKRYYDENEFISNGVQHYKISCPGQMIPPSYMMHQFFNVVDEFMQSANGEDKYIGVHCTHGINRTGYFICNYMIKKLGYTAKKAISAFQEARGHPIERAYFIKELKNPTSDLPSTECNSEDPSRLNQSHQRKAPQTNSGNLKRRFDHYSKQSQLNYYDDEQSGSNNWYQNSYQNNNYRNLNYPNRGNQSGGSYSGNGSYRNSNMGKNVPKYEGSFGAQPAKKAAIQTDYYTEQYAPNQQNVHKHKQSSSFHKTSTHTFFGLQTKKVTKQDN